MKTKVHTRYKLADGTLVPGVTTVLNILAKPALIHWAWKLGCEGKDYKKVRDTAADIGTLAHLMISSHWRNEPPDLDDYTKTQIDKAETAYLAYLEWESGKVMEPLAIEEPMVSEQFGYGGTPDWFGFIDRATTLLDFKTGKAIYPEHRIQLASYDKLVIETKTHTPSQAIILHINKETGEFAAHNIKLNGDEFELFLTLLRAYRLKKKLW